MEITRTRTTIYKVTQVAVDFLEFSEEFIRIRKGFKYQGFQCFSCHKKFEMGEKISLFITNKGNKVACQKCGVEAKEQLESAGELQ